MAATDKDSDVPEVGETVDASKTPVRDPIWSRRNFWAIVGVAIAFTALVLGIITLPGNDGASRPSSPTPVTSNSSSSTTSPPPGAATSTPVGDSCRDSGGVAVVACATPGSRLVVSGTECAQGAVLRSWGLDPEVEQLRLDVRLVAGTCTVGGANLSGSQAVEAADLIAAAGGRISPDLRTCARLGGQPEVACNTPHELEWTSPWSRRDETKEVLSGQCHDIGTRYTDRTLAENGELTAPLILATRGTVPYYRCAIRSTGVLNGSVRKLGSSELPSAPS
jgi:hypothetical protein